jgi:hypothetical protein
MSNVDRPKSFAELLVAQDEPISETQFKEYRMHLEQKLASAARFERRVRITAIVAWLVAILLPLGLVVVDRILRGMSPLPPIRLALPVEIHALPGTIGNLVGVLYMTTMSFAWLIVLVYLIKSRPAFQRARDEYQAAVFADLQRQLAEIRQQTPPSN